MMNLQPQTDPPPMALARPGGRNLLLGLTMRRLLWALVINAVIAVLGAQVRVWPSVEQAMVSAQIVGLSIMLSWTIASNLRLFWLPPLGAQLLSIVMGSAIGTVAVVVIKSYIYDYEFGSIVRDPFGAIALLTLGVIFGGFVILTV